MKDFSAVTVNIARVMIVAFAVSLFASFASYSQPAEAAPKAKMTKKRAWAICRKKHGNRLARVRIVNNKARCIVKKRTAKKKKRRKTNRGGITFNQALAWCKREYKWAATVQVAQRNGRWICYYWN